MSLRRIVSGVVVTAVVASTWALVPAAHADPPFVPDADDIVGVGSDTTQFALNYLAEGRNGVPGFNAGGAAARLATFDAYQPGTEASPVTGDPIEIRPGYTIARPNGSGAGKSKLYGAGNDANVSFARSSSSLSTAEASAGLFQIPFAKDALKMAVSGSASNAPANLTIAQILSIYKGDITNWSQVGGTAGTIVPMIPQSGSGTRSFFLAQLQAANGGVAPVLGGSVIDVQEHDPVPIQGNANAIAPFSAGRAALAGTLRLVNGWEAARAVYNVVRQADLGRADIQAIFGVDGFVCSAAAKPLIAAAGFDQLLRPAQGGVCGEATQTATTDLDTTTVATTTSVAGTSPAGGQLRLTATLGPSNADPQGTVQFLLDGSATVAATGVVQQRTATVTLSGLATGNHTVVARYKPSNGTNFEASESPSTAVVVRSGSTTSMAVTPTKGSWGAERTLTATVMAGAAPATGSVTFKLGTTSKTVTLSGGKASMVVPASTKAGSHDVTATYGGTATVAPSTATGDLVINKAKAKITELFGSTVAAGARAKGVVKVKLVGISATAKGSLVVKLGKKTVGKGKLKKGKAALTLSALPKGTHKLTILYSGNANVSKAKLGFSITQK